MKPPIITIHAVLAVCVCFCFSYITAEAQEPYPPAPPVTGSEDFGRHIQRTMSLLETSSPQNRNTVRILFYGQSITDQQWTQEVERHLKQKYPHADLQFAKRSIGGFSSQLLVHTAEVDLYPFYPDLLIFHVYGANNTYEDIIRRTRQRTTSEVLMATDHANKLPAESPDPEGDKGEWWSHMMNNVFLPQIAQKYGCQLADVRTPWVQYLKANDYEPSKLLKDGVHLNDHGNFLMAELIKREFVHRAELADNGSTGLVRTYEVGKDVMWQEGKLTLEFEGNRIDLIAEHGAMEGVSAKVLIDGKEPSTFPGCYTMTRTTTAPGAWFPSIKSVSWNAAPLLEQWIARITQANDDPAAIGFEVIGSMTGPDGNGTTGERFVSNSGRVVIEPAAWSFDFAKAVSGGRTPPVGFEIQWTILPLHQDTYHVPPTPDGSLTYATTVVQGITNEQHVLTLTADTMIPAIRAIRVHAPPIP